MRIPTGFLVLILLLAGLVTVNNNSIADPAMRDAEDDIFVGLNIPEETFITSLRIQCQMETTIPFANRTNHTFEYEYSISGEVGLVGDWNDTAEIIEVNGSVAISIMLFLREGKENYVHFRVKNSTGSSNQSRTYNIWCDVQSPRFSLKSHTEYESYVYLEQDIRFEITDLVSGVNGSSIEYRYNTTEMEDFSEWIKYDPIQNGNRLWISITLTLSRGHENRIMVKALDLTGHQSIDGYRIKIQSYPVINITSPEDGDHFEDNEEILFNANSTYDIDGDRLSFLWLYRTDGDWELLSEVMTFTRILEEGEYNISLMVEDVVNNIAWMNFSISVINMTVEDPDDNITEPDQNDTEPEKNDTEPDKNLDSDGDGIPDWFEDEYGLNKYMNDSYQDTDNDGYTNIEEYELDSDPLDHNDPVDWEIDTDGDGMPDWYEKKYKLDPNIDDSMEDPDGDGIINIREYGDGEYKGLNLTDPRSPNPYYPIKPIDETDDEEDNGGSYLLIIIIAISVVLILAIVLVVILIVVRIKKKNKDEENGEVSQEDQTV